MRGRLIQGRFEIVDEIGHGGMGVVYRARQISLDRIVALKMLSTELINDVEFRERFRQEARIIARLSHPNIIQVHDIYDIEGEDGGFCIVMEYLDGHSLRDQLRALARFPVGRAVAIARQVLSGLAYAHEQGIVHRDVKPDNIMMLSGDRVKLMDFGIARLSESTIRTHTGVTMGTPQYMSPEQAAGRPVDARSDIYSLGLVLYAMITGEPPFTGDSPVMVALKHIQDVPRRPSETVPTIPPALDAVIMKALAKNPDDRHATAREFREALGPFMPSDRVPAVPDDDEATVISGGPLLPGSLSAAPSPETKTPPSVGTQRPDREGGADVTPVSVMTTAPLQARRFSWGWVFAALPGLLALALVLYYLTFRTGSITRANMENEALASLEKRMDEVSRKSPERFGRFIRENEGPVRRRFETEYVRALERGNAEGIRHVRAIAGKRVLPYLTDEQRRQWEKRFEPSRDPQDSGPRGPGMGPPGPGAVPLDPVNERIRSMLRERREIGNVPRDPEKAKELSQEAERLGSALLDKPGLVDSLQLEACIRVHTQAIAHDPDNFAYHLNFARFLNEMTRRTPRPLHGSLIDRALLHVESAQRLAKGQIKEEALTSLRQELEMQRGFIGPGGPGPGMRGGPMRGRQGPFARPGEAEDAPDSATVRQPRGFRFREGMGPGPGGPPPGRGPRMEPRSPSREATPE
jgi:serine/threonine protein kinase